MTQFLVCYSDRGTLITRFTSHLLQANGHSVCVGNAQVWDGLENDYGTWKIIETSMAVSPVCRRCKQRRDALERTEKRKRDAGKTKEQLQAEREVDLLLRLDPGYAQRLEVVK